MGVGVMGANKGRERGGAGRRNCFALLTNVAACASTATRAEYGAPSLLANASIHDTCSRADLGFDLYKDSDSQDNH